MVETKGSDSLRLAEWLQDNGSWCGPSSVRNGPILSQDWYRVGGGDGFYSQVDPSDYNIVYAESQGGNMRRVNLRTGEQGSIRPQAPSERSLETNIRPEPPITTEIRWNWNTPLLLSPTKQSQILTWIQLAVRRVERLTYKVDRCNNYMDR